MPIRSFIQIHCRPAAEIHVGSRIIQGLLIDGTDADYLLAADDPDMIVSLTCPGRNTVHVRQPLLRARMVPAPHSDDWYISVTGTGPLFRK
jgi:hypothetical protein